MGIRNIALLALCESALYSAASFALPAWNLLHSGVLLPTLLSIFLGIAIAVISATLSHLVEKACEIKRENDLTI